MDEIRIASEDGGAVRRITLNRPEKRNALTREMFAELTAAFEREPPAAERLTVLDAAGPVFCAGVDLGERADNPAGEGQSPLEVLCEAVWRYPLPVVAVVSGHAIGGGFMLALHCDFVVADEAAQLGNAAVQMGLAPPWPLARRLAVAAGTNLGRRLLLLGDPMRARALAEAEVIEAAVRADDLPQAAVRIIDRLAQNAPLSLRAVKATLNATAYAELPHRRETAAIATVQESEDAREGVAARREKRPALFSGR